MDFMEELVGIPYKDGGLSPEEGFDCWGLSRWCIKILAGVELPEKPLTWRHYGCLLDKDARIERGDLLFCVANPPNRIHMGVAKSSSELIHASIHTGQVVCEPVAARRECLPHIVCVQPDSSHPHV